MTAGVMAAVPRIRPALKVARPFGVGRRRAEDFIVLGEQRQFDAGDRLGAAERAGEDVQPIGAGIGGEADIGDDEPLRRLADPIPGRAPFGDRGQDVDAGLALRQRLIDREAGDDFLVQVRLDVDRTLPDQFAAVVLDALGAVAVELGQELRIAAAARRCCGRRCGRASGWRWSVLTETNGMPRRAVAGSTKLSPVKRTHGGAVLDVDVEIDLGVKVLVDGGGQAGAQRQSCSAGRGSRPSTQICVALGFDAPWVRAPSSGDEGRVVDAGS